jgi:hypothetical protein
VYCGIDWAEGHHDVAVVDEDGRLVAKARISDDLGGLAQLLEMLAARGDRVEDPIPVAIETGRGLLVACLRGSRNLYAINPMAVARYRERRSVAGAKSDHVDAMTLGNVRSVLTAPDLPEAEPAQRGGEQAEDSGLVPLERPVVAWGCQVTDSCRLYGARQAVIRSRLGLPALLVPPPARVRSRDAVEVDACSDYPAGGVLDRRGGCHPREPDHRVSPTAIAEPVPAARSI